MRKPYTEAEILELLPAENQEMIRDILTSFNAIKAGDGDAARLTAGVLRVYKLSKEKHLVLTDDRAVKLQSIMATCGAKIRYGMELMEQQIADRQWHQLGVTLRDLRSELQKGMLACDELENLMLRQ